MSPTVRIGKSIRSIDKIQSNERFKNALEPTINNISYIFAHIVIKKIIPDLNKEKICQMLNFTDVFVTFI